MCVCVCVCTCILGSSTIFGWLVRGVCVYVYVHFGLQHHFWLVGWNVCVCVCVYVHFGLQHHFWLVG